MIDLTQTEKAREVRCRSSHLAGPDLKQLVVLLEIRPPGISLKLQRLSLPEGISMFNLASRIKWIITRERTRR